MTIGILLNEDNIKLIKSYETPSFLIPKHTEENSSRTEEPSSKERDAGRSTEKNPINRYIRTPRTWKKKEEKKE